MNVHPEGAFGRQVARTRQSQRLDALFVRVELGLDVKIAPLVVLRSHGNFKHDFNLVELIVHSNILVFLRSYFIFVLLFFCWG